MGKKIIAIIDICLDCRHYLVSSGFCVKKKKYIDMSKVGEFISDWCPLEDE